MPLSCLGHKRVEPRDPIFIGTRGINPCIDFIKSVLGPFLSVTRGSTKEGLILDLFVDGIGILSPSVVDVIVYIVTIVEPHRMDCG